MTHQPRDGKRSDTPRPRQDILRPHDDSLSGALMGGVALALLLIFGVAIYVLGSGDPEVASSDAPRIERTTPAPSTTGQGGTRITPGRDQNIPNPTPPAPPRQGAETAK